MHVYFGILMFTRPNLAFNPIQKCVNSSINTSFRKTQAFFKGCNTNYSIQYANMYCANDIFGQSHLNHPWNQRDKKKWSIELISLLCKSTFRPLTWHVSCLSVWNPAQNCISSMILWFICLVPVKLWYVPIHSLLLNSSSITFIKILLSLAFL